MMNCHLNRSLVVCLVLALVNFGCGKKDDETTGETPPEIPSNETLQLNVGSLKEGNKLVGAVGSNHTAAFLAASVTGVAVALQFAVPVAAISKALEQTPKIQSDGSWLWTYAFAHGGTSYSAELTATAGATVGTWAWQLAVTKSPADANGCCQNFTWLSGIRTTATTGSWTINDPRIPSTTTPLRTVDWRFSSETDKELTVKVASVDSDVSGWEVGGSVHFSILGTAHTLSIDKSPADTAKIVVSWDASTKAGSMLKEDGSTVCWDSSLTNVACSN